SRLSGPDDDGVEFQHRFDLHARDHSPYNHHSTLVWSGLGAPSDLSRRARTIGGTMTTAPTAASTRREPELLGQTVVGIGGSAGIGLEPARRARAEGASVILTGRNPERLKQAALELDAQRTAAFDATDPASLQSFFQDLPTPIDHVMVTAGAPHY